MMAGIIKESIINIDPDKINFDDKESVKELYNHRAAKHHRTSCPGKCQAQRGESAASGRDIEPKG